MSKAIVCVTGASGYIAAHVVNDLAKKGTYQVRGTVRSLAKKEIIQPLQALSKDLKLFESDLLKPDSFDAAFAGCKYVIHTASPFFFPASGSHDEVVGPAVNGTLNVLRAALKAKVKRVVITSSMAAVCGDQRKKNPGHIWTEANWNNEATAESSAYSYSKTAAEKAAWDFVKDKPELEIVTINPSFVMGPPLLPRAGTSVSYVKSLLAGDYKDGAPARTPAIVDVRTVSEAHVKAIEVESAKGRHVCSNTAQVSMFALSEAIRSAYPNFPLPKVELAESKPVNPSSDHSKAEKELGVKFRPYKETMVDMVKAMIDLGIVKAP